MDENKSYEYLPILPCDPELRLLKVWDVTGKRLFELRKLRKHSGFAIKRRYEPKLPEPDPLSDGNVNVSAHHLKLLRQYSIPPPNLKILQRQAIDGKIQVYQGGAPELGRIRFKIPWEEITELPAYFQMIVPGRKDEAYGRARVRERICAQAEKHGFDCRFVVMGQIMTVTIVGRKQPKKK